MKIYSLITTLSVILLTLSCRTTESPEYLLRVSLFVNEQDTWYQAFEYFKEQLERESEGRIGVELYPSEQLAKEIESIRLIQADVIDMTVTGSLLSNWIEIAAFCELPYLITSLEEQISFINSPIGQRIESEMISEVGLRPLTYFIRGPRQLTTNRPIHSPEDLQGLILRVPNVPSFVTAWQAMGAKPTPMAFSEVFSSMQQGTIEALENPLSLIYNAGFAEVQDYVIETNHVLSWSYPVIGEQQYQRLPPDLQELLLRAAEDMQRHERSLFLENEKRLVAALESKGMTFIEVDPKEFAAECRDAIYESLSPAMQEVYHEVIASLKNINHEKSN